MVDLFKQINGPAVLVHISLLVLVATGLYLAGITLDMAALSAALLYLLFSMLLRRIIPVHQNRGIQLLGAGRYKEAIGAFQKSYEQFTKSKWLDDYRIITLLSASKISYREMALYNQAICMFEDGDADAARKGYERVLQEFPNSRIAKEALAFMDNPETDEETETT